MPGAVNRCLICAAARTNITIRLRRWPRCSGCHVQNLHPTHVHPVHAERARARRCCRPRLRPGAGRRARCLAVAAGRVAVGQGRRHRPLRARQRGDGAFPGPAGVGHPGPQRCRTVRPGLGHRAGARPSRRRWRRAQPLGSEHRFEWAGARHDFCRAAPGDAGRRAGPALAVQRLDRPGAAAPEARRSCAPRSSSSSSSSGPTRRCAASSPTRACATAPPACTRRAALRRPVAPRGRPVDARAPRVRDGAASRSTRSTERVLALGAPARGAHPRGHGPAAARQHAGDGRVLPARRAALRACCCRAWAWPPRIRAWKACAASAPRRSSCSTARNWASRVSMGVASFPHTAHIAGGPAGGLRRRAGRGAAPRRQPRHAGQHPLRAG